MVVVVVVCGCLSVCNVYGYVYVGVWGCVLLMLDVKGFWGVFGCLCWVV